jgi:hypothetical protein
VHGKMDERKIDLPGGTSRTEQGGWTARSDVRLRYRVPVGNDVGADGLREYERSTQRESGGAGEAHANLLSGSVRLTSKEGTGTVSESRPANKA